MKQLMGLLFLVCATHAHAESPSVEFKQAVEQFQKNPNDGALRERIITLSRQIKPAPAIPEGARRAFVRGNTAFSEAKNQDDYARAQQRYEEALVIAPWWGDPYFNLAKAQELHQDYSRAIQSLKLFVLTGPSPADARKAQDYSYALEDKQDKLAKDKLDEKQKKRDYQDKIGFLAGRWNVASTFHCPCAWNGNVYRWIDTITIQDKSILITNDNGVTLLKGTIEGDDYTSIKWVKTEPEPNAYQQGRSLPDFPINVTIDKSNHQIRWKEPVAERGYTSTWSWSGSNDIQLTQ